jgi:hypothetical protein
MIDRAVSTGLRRGLQEAHTPPLDAGRRRAVLCVSSVPAAAVVLHPNRQPERCSFSPILASCTDHSWTDLSPHCRTQIVVLSAV